MRVLLGMILGMTLLMSAVASTMSLQLVGGQSFEGKLKKIQNQVVTLVEANGRVRPIRYSSLSSYSQQQIKQWAQKQGGSIDYASWIGTPESAFRKSWPGTVYAPVSSGAKAVYSEFKKGRYVYESTHFRFVSDAKLEPKVVNRFAKLFETTHKLLTSMPVNPSCQYRDQDEKYMIYLFAFILITKAYS